MSTIFADKFKNTSGGNPVQINQLRGIDTAGSITIQGENTNTTNLQQGLCKSWAFLNGQSTIAMQDSFNNSSPTDHGTGEYTFNFTTNMSNALYSSKFSGISQTNTGAHTTATSSIRVRVRDGSNNNYDSQQVMTGIHGDLA